MQNSIWSSTPLLWVFCPKCVRVVYLRHLAQDLLNGLINHRPKYHTVSGVYFAKDEAENGYLRLARFLVWQFSQDSETIVKSVEKLADVMSATATTQQQLGIDDCSDGSSHNNVFSVSPTNVANVGGERNEFVFQKGCIVNPAFCNTVRDESLAASDKHNQRILDSVQHLAEPQWQRAPGWVG